MISTYFLPKVAGHIFRQSRAISNHSFQNSLETAYEIILFVVYEPLKLRLACRPSFTIFNRQIVSSLIMYKVPVILHGTSFCGNVWPTGRRGQFWLMMKVTIQTLLMHRNSVWSCSMFTNYNVNYTTWSRTTTFLSCLINQQITFDQWSRQNTDRLCNDTRIRTNTVNQLLSIVNGFLSWSQQCRSSEEVPIFC